MTTETEKRNVRRTVRGTVSSDKMDKTITVSVSRQMKHPQYGKFVQRRSQYKVHDENNEAKAGDVVLIEETRRLSKDKCWRLVQILRKAETVE